MASGKPYQLVLNQTIQLQFSGHAEFQSGIITNFPDNSFVVRFPQNEPLPEGLAPGQSIVVHLADASGLRVGNTKIVELCAPPRPGVIVALPPSFEIIQRRRFFRVSVDFPCTVQVLDATGMPVPQHRDAHATVLDISAGGARITTSCAVGVDDHLLLDIIPIIEKDRTSEPVNRLPAGGKTPGSTPTPIHGVRVQPPKGQTAPPAAPTIQAMARVIRLVPPPAETPNLLQAAVEFERLTTRTQDRLVTLIFDVQRSQCNRS